MRASTGSRLLLLRAAIGRAGAAATTSSSSAAPSCAPATAAPLALLCRTDRRDISTGSGLITHHRHHVIDTADAPWSRAFVGTGAGARPWSRAAFSSSSAAAAAEMHGTTVLAVRHRGSIVIMADGQISMGSKVVKPNARKLRRLLPTAAAVAGPPAPPASHPSSSPAPSSSSPSAPSSVPAPLGDLSALPGGGLVIGGFAGSTADGVALFERLEARLCEHPGQLRRAAVDLAKAWRQDRVLRRLRAAMLVADATGACLEVSGNGDVLEPADGVHAIGSGARHALAAARALVRLDADERRLGATAGGGGDGGGGGGGDGAGEGGAASASGPAEDGGAPAPAAAAAPAASKGLFTALDIARRAMRVASDRCVYTNTCWTWEGIDERTGVSFSGGSGGGGDGKQQQQH